MSGLTSHLKGQAAEDSVARFYQHRGAIILGRRWRGPGGEIDLIVREGATTVFVEVKSSGTVEKAFGRVTTRQAARIASSAEAFLDTLPKGQLSEMRIDVAAMDLAGRIEICENALLA